MGARPVSDEYISANAKFLASPCNEQNRKEMTKLLKGIIIIFLKDFFLFI